MSSPDGQVSGMAAPAMREAALVVEWVARRHPDDLPEGYHVDGEPQAWQPQTRFARKIAAHRRRDRATPGRRDGTNSRGGSMCCAALGGFFENEPDNPFVLNPASSVDRMVVPGPLKTQRLEDLQIFSFLGSLAASGDADHPTNVNLAPAGDPPDRVVTFGHRAVAVELVRLSVGDVLPQFALVRTIRRGVEAKIHENESAYPHLQGTAVSLYFFKQDRIPTKSSPAIQAIVEVLKEDRGVVEHVVYNDEEGRPVVTAPNPYSGGVYADYDYVQIRVEQVESNGENAPPTVSAAVQRIDKLYDALAVLRQRVEEKDRRSVNKLLLVTCGLPDAQGCQSPPDSILFHTIVEAHENGQIFEPPKNLNTVVLHHWLEGHFAVLWNRDGALMPWHKYADQPT